MFRLIFISPTQITRIDFSLPTMGYLGVLKSACQFEIFIIFMNIKNKYELGCILYEGNRKTVYERLNFITIRFFVWVGKS